METLIHYSRQPLTQIKSVPSTAQPNHFKPMGLWVSVDGPDDWKTWCEAEAFGLENLAYPHKIILSTDANILRLSSAHQIDAFTTEYCSSQQLARLCRFKVVEWERVAKRHDGIIIAPYVYARRLNVYARRLIGGADWYYAWDCASGCIWNASIVTKIVPMKQSVTC